MASAIIISIEVLLIVLTAIFSITFHEYARGLAAYKLGDITPGLSGKLTINPIRHIDIVGTIILPIFLMIVTRGRFVFGYARPMPMNINHFKAPRRNTILVEITGLLFNLSVAIILSIVLHTEIKDINIIKNVIQYGILINLILFSFNLIPIPPLNGSKVIAVLLPYKSAYKYLKAEAIGIMTITILFMSGLINWFVTPILRMLLSIMGLSDIVI